MLELIHYFKRYFHIFVPVLVVCVCSSSLLLQFIRFSFVRFLIIFSFLYYSSVLLHILLLV